VIAPGDHVHVVGVGGVGMSALAQALVSQRARVTGSDRDRDRGEDLPIFGQLRGAGVRIVRQDGMALGPTTRAVAVSTAIEGDNPDVQAAARLGVPVVHRAEMLARLAEGRKCVAITGTSGKSTVTGMVGWILDRLGADPTVVNGAPVLNWRSETRVGNFRQGRSDVWVLEADESDRSLLHFHPDWALITNVSKDHFDIETTRALFDAFAKQSRHAVLDAGAAGGLLDGFSPTVTPDSSSFVFRGVRFDVPLPGRHNAENALCAAALCERMGYGLEAVRGALAGFLGIHRRLEAVGSAGGVRVLDDYAHNPAKIAAAMAAVRPANGRLFSIWRPHGYRPLRTMLAELVETFRAACRPGDRVAVLPVYDAGGTADRTINADALVALLLDTGVDALLVADYAAAEAACGDARAGDTVLVMGARDPHLPDLARRVLHAARSRPQ
jgi:UDP-N-acetylmuramate--alanine ligase